MKKENFDITGMMCASCQANVNNAVCNLNGVRNVNVNLISNTMMVEYDEKKINTETIIDAVKNIGYGASIEDSSKSVIRKLEERTIRNEKNIISLRNRLFVSILFWIPLMYVAMHNMFAMWFGIPVPSLIRNNLDGVNNAIKFALVQILLLIPIIIVNRKYYISGFRGLLKGKPNMDSLVALGSMASIIYGLFTIYRIVNIKMGDASIVEKYMSDLYFESAGTILTLVTVGKYLETKSKGRTGEALSKLVNLAPKTAILNRDGEEIEIPVEHIKNGDILVIKPGASIPVDGEVTKGCSTIDESAITGESIPVQKNVGDKVISGTINKNGILKIETEKVGDETTLSQIIKLVENASNSKAPISRLADKVASVFVPIVILISIFAALVWLIIGMPFDFCISIGIAVLVISCPCALGLATPVAIVVSAGKAAENNILIKSAESIEILHTADVVMLDKTGTITEGKPKVVDIITNQDIMLENNRNQSKIKYIGNLNNAKNLQRNILEIAGSLEKNSEHPLAEAIINEVMEENITLKDVQEFESVTGQGIKGIIDGEAYFGGNLLFMTQNGINTEFYEKKAYELEENGKTTLYFANSKEVIGIIAIQDVVKESSIQAIKKLNQNGMKVIMITGDNKRVADNIGKVAGVDEIISEVLPQEKEKEVSKRQQNGMKVAFVGDGINDSPALAKADVGIAIGNGTDIAIESADVVLVKSDLRDVDTAIKLSKQTINNIKLSLFWAFFYNVLCIPIACGILYPKFGIKLNPMIGAAAMSLSSVCVVMNALRLKLFRKDT